MKYGIQANSEVIIYINPFAKNLTNIIFVSKFKVT